MRHATAALATLALSLAACGDSTGPDQLPGTGKALVLVSFGEPGIAVLGDTGTSAPQAGLGDAFDGVVFTVKGDSVLTTSSKAGGDELYVMDVGTGATRVIALMAGSNPAGAIFLPSGAQWQGASYAVALRDSGAVGLVDLTGPGGAPELGLVRQMGACPTDLFVGASALWSVDANQNCRDAYQSLGPVRLIRATLGSNARDTVTLADSVRGAARAFVVDGEAIVTASGDFAGRQARVVAVDLATRQVRATLRFPAGWYATASRLGADGALYVTAARGWPEPYEPRVFRVDPSTLAFSGARTAGADHLDLRENGALVRCDAASADAEGELWCASNGSVASRVLVFGAQAAIERTIPIPTGIAADIFVR